MSNAKSKMLVIVSAVFLVLVGIGLYILFEKQGYGNYKRGEVISYNLKDYVDTTLLTYNDYDDVYTSINVSKVTIKNIEDSPEINSFEMREEEIIGYIKDYYEEMHKEDYLPASSVDSVIKTQINGTVLSVYYEVDFLLDKDIYEDNEKKYITTIKIDLATNKVLSTEDLLSKYNYTKEYISEKIFEEDVMIDKGQIVIDKSTNISLTEDDIVRKKDTYVNGIISEFNNIMKVYIEKGTLVIVYDTKELNDLFFDNYFETNIKTKYLK